MAEEDRNPDIIRKVIKELSNVRKEQRIIRLWGGVLLGGNLLLLAGFLWVSKQDIKQPAPVETFFQYPPAAIPAEEDDNTSNTNDIIDNTDVVDVLANDNTDTDNNTNNNTEIEDNTDNVNDTADSPDESQTQTEYPSTSVPASIPVTAPTTVNKAPYRAPAAKTARRTMRANRKNTAVAIPTSIITRQGMTLRSLARRYYGSEVFWVYIYDRNIRVISSLDSSSFDTLPSGIQLEMPRPADYGIDATEPLSLQRACNLAKNLEKQEKNKKQ